MKSRKKVGPGPGLVCHEMMQRQTKQFNQVQMSKTKKKGKKFQSNIFVWFFFVFHICIDLNVWFDILSFYDWQALEVGFF